MWEEECKRQQGIPDVKSSVQGQTMFMLHPLFSEKIQSATADAGARWNESHAYICTHTGVIVQVLVSAGYTSVYLLIHGAEC